jgi:CheY-like chemotaxis protein
MTVLIESLGVAVRTAKDGAEALEAVKQEKPAIMLLDLMMPNVDGLAVLRALQANPDVRDIPVLVMTATRFEKTELSEVYARVLDVVRKGDLPMGEISRVIEKTVSDRQTDHFAHEEARDNDQRT